MTDEQRSDSKALISGPYSAVPARLPGTAIVEVGDDGPKLLGGQPVTSRAADRQGISGEGTQGDPPERANASGVGRGVEPAQPMLTPEGAEKIRKASRMTMSFLHKNLKKIDGYNKLFSNVQYYVVDISIKNIVGRFYAETKNQGYKVEVEYHCDAGIADPVAAYERGLPSVDAALKNSVQKKVRDTLQNFAINQMREAKVALERQFSDRNDGDIIEVANMSFELVLDQEAEKYIKDTSGSDIIREAIESRYNLEKIEDQRNAARSESIESLQAAWMTSKDDRYLQILNTKIDMENAKIDVRRGVLQWGLQNGVIDEADLHEKFSKIIEGMSEADLVAIPKK